MSAALPEFVERLILDGTKVGFYPDRIAAWQRGEKIAPITIDCAMTRACNAACSFCVFPDTAVLMEDGTDKRIVDVVAGDNVVSVDDAGRPCISRVVARWQTSANDKGLRLRLQSGKMLECTAGHLALTDFGWLPAGALRVGDYVWSARTKNQADVNGRTGSDQEKNARKQLRRRADDERGESKEAQRADEETKPHARSRVGSENAADYGGNAGPGLSLQDVQAAVEGRALSCESGPAFEGAQGYQCAHEGRQPNEAAWRGGECSRELLVGEEEGCVGTHDENLEGRQPHPEYVPWQGQREGCEQDGAAAVSACQTAPRSVRGRRNILASGDGERDQPQPGFHIRQRQGEDSSVGPRSLLAQGQDEGPGRDQRLFEGGLVPVRAVDQGSDQPVDDAGHQGADRFVAERSQIVSISDAGNSPVYDLECTPHHNFIAGGIVVHNCYAQLQASEGEKITREHFFNFLDDAAEIGVKGVSFISDGESTVVPWYADAVEHAASVGLAVGAGSNGIKLTRPVLERILPHLSYLRFNFSAGERRRYAEIMGVRQEMYDVVVENIKDGMEIIRRDGLSCSLNMQLVCDPKDGDQLIPFAKLACELRPSYAVIKHCADDVTGSLGVDYSKYPALAADFDDCERLGREAGVRIEVKRARLDGKRNYSKCFGPPFIMQLSGNGTVAPCGFLFNEKYKAFHIGSIAQERFRDIWASDRYDEVMRYLASDAFDPRSRCGPNCLQHNTNDFLFRYVNGKVSLPTTAAPPDMAFI